MNLVIINNEKKEFHPYIYVTENIEMFIMNNIIKINEKYNTYLQVQTNVDMKYFEEKGYTLNQGLFDTLVLKYNSDLQEGEQRLNLWIRDF